MDILLIVFSILKALIALVGLGFTITFYIRGLSNKQAEKRTHNLQLALKAFLFTAGLPIALTILEFLLKAYF